MTTYINQEQSQSLSIRLSSSLLFGISPLWGIWERLVVLISPFSLLRRTLAEAFLQLSMSRFHRKVPCNNSWSECSRVVLSERMGVSWSWCEAGRRLLFSRRLKRRIQPETARSCSGRLHTTFCWLAECLRYVRSQTVMYKNSTDRPWRHVVDYHTSMQSWKLVNSQRTIRNIKDGLFGSSTGPNNAVSVNRGDGTFTSRNLGQPQSTPLHGVKMPLISTSVFSNDANGVNFHIIQKGKAPAVCLAEISIPPTASSVFDYFSFLPKAHVMTRR